MISQEIRNKFPQYADYSDQAFSAAVWNLHYKDKLPFSDFAKRIGYTMIPGEPATPDMPTTQTLAQEGVDVLGSVINRMVQNMQAVPALGIGATALSRAAQLPSAGQKLQAVGKAVQPLIPKTGGELTKQVLTAGAVAPVGYVGEQLAEPVAEAAGKIVPTLSGKRPQQTLTSALQIPLGVGAEVGTSLGLGRTSKAIRDVMAKRPSGIPEERLETARSIEAIGGKYPTSELLRGRDISSLMSVYNQRYNKLVGLPPKTDFGIREFKEARNLLNQEYDNILSGETVKFDKKFFSDIKDLLNRQRQLGETGVMFAESRPIINTLSQIGNLPKSLQARIAALRDIPPDTNDPAITRNALKVIDDSIGFLQNQEISMDARVYNELRSELGKAAYRTADDSRAKVLRQMQKAFDDAADSSLPKDKVNRLQTARNRWENLQILEEAQVGREPGLILPQDVARVTSKRDPQGMIYGDKEMFKIGSEGLSMPARAEAATRETTVPEFLPTQVGGYRQKAAIGQRIGDVLVGGAKKRALMEGPITPEEFERKQLLQKVRSVGGGAMRAFESPEGEQSAIEER